MVQYTIDTFSIVDGSIDSSLVVFIFGFVGSNPAQLNKYASACICSGKVKRVYTLTAQTFDVFFRPKALEDMAKAALAVATSCHENDKIILFSMSNGGAFVHNHLSKLMFANPGRYQAVKIAGVIFDSAPAYLTAHSGSRALSESIKNATIRKIVYWLAMLIFPLIMIMFGLDGPKRYFREMEDDSIKAPSLYIYSLNDELTDAAQLEALIEKRKTRQQQGKVKTLCLANSPHVAHLRKHPDQYLLAIKDFLSSVC